MIKILYNNMVLDINKNERYVRYIPEINRFVSSSRDSANGILGSDNIPFDSKETIFKSAIL